MEEKFSQYLPSISPDDVTPLSETPDGKAKATLAEQAPEGNHMGSISMCPGQAHPDDTRNGVHIMCNDCGQEAFLGKPNESKFNRQVGKAPIVIQAAVFGRYHHLGTPEGSDTPIWKDKLSNVNRFFRRDDEGGRSGIGADPSQKHLRPNDDGTFDWVGRAEKRGMDWRKEGFPYMECDAEYQAHCYKRAISSGKITPDYFTGLHFAPAPFREKCDVRNPEFGERGPVYRDRTW